MKDKYELEYSFICLDWTLTNKDIIGYNYYKPKKVTVYTITDYYLDTEDRLLQQNKYVFRKRLNTKNSSIIYTIKGPTKITDSVPKRLELESDDYKKILTELENRLDVKEPREMEIIHRRITYRTEVRYDAYIMFIDKTMYQNGAEYFNIELECNDESRIGNVVGFSKDLKSRKGIFETNYSKFQIGQVVEKLNIEDRIGIDEYMKILGYKQ